MYVMDVCGMSVSIVCVCHLSSETKPWDTHTKTDGDIAPP